MLRILGYTQLYTLVVLMLTSCCQDRQAMERAEQALQEVGERYHAEKSICDSLLDVATSYYLPDLAKGDTTLSSFTSSAQQAECMLYEGIRHHDRAQQLKPDMEAYAAEMGKAYRLFLEVERNEEILAEPYLKGVINDRLALVNMLNEKQRRALSYFQKELHYSLLMNDTTAIALSYMHLSYSYYKLEICDSALFYSNKALFLAPHLDGRIIAALYANNMHLRHHFGVEDERNDSLIAIIPFDACLKNDSCRIYTILADYYIEKGKYYEADSLLRWTISHSDGRPELLSMSYQRRSKLFERKGMIDSALMLHKSFLEQHTLVSQSKLETEMAETQGRFVELQKQRHHERVVAIITVISLLAIVFLLFLWLYRVKRVHQLECRIANINAKMSQYAADLAQSKSKIDKQMSESKDREEKLKRQLRNSLAINQSSHAQIVDMLRHFFLLDEGTPWPPIIYEELLAIYRESSSARRCLLDELDKLGLSTRHKVICLLISERKLDSKRLWVYAGCTSEAAFQSTKSQIKRKLTEAASSSHEIQNLLKRFPQERGPVPRPIPKLKNEG